MKNFFTFTSALALMPSLAIILSSCSDNGEAPSFELNMPEAVTLTAGETLRFDFLSTGDYSLDLTAPTGWTFVEESDRLALTAPARTSPGAQFSGTVDVTAYDGKTAIANYTAEVVTVEFITFEDVPAQYLAIDIAGSNLDEDYVGYTDMTTDLEFAYPNYWDYGFMMGGMAISQWNDMETPSYPNQCSVYYEDAATGKGGNNGSETFSIVYAASGMGPSMPTYVEFGNGEEKVIDHMYISNATYAVLSMRNGDNFARILGYDDQDWFSVTIQGYDKDGVETGAPVEHYLADFRTSDSPGIVLDWHRVDLSSIGKVNRLQFFMNGSNNPTPNNGNNNLKTPAYFCMDDIAIQL